MNVKELMDALARADPEAAVVVSYWEDGRHAPTERMEIRIEAYERPAKRGGKAKKVVEIKAA